MIYEIVTKNHRGDTGYRLVSTRSRRFFIANNLGTRPSRCNIIHVIGAAVCFVHRYIMLAAARYVLHQFVIHNQTRSPA